VTESLVDRVIRRQTWLEKVQASEDPLYFSVIDKASGKAAGRQTFMRIEPAHGRIEIGHIHWGPAIARKPAATEAHYLFMRHAFEDLGYRLMRQLVGQDHAPSREQLPENAILVARSMGPAALLDYDRKRLRGLVLEEGGPTSHVSIVARALGIPAVGEIANATGLVEQGPLAYARETGRSLHWTARRAAG